MLNMNQEIIDKLNLSVDDCNKFMNVVNFFHKYHKKDTGFEVLLYKRMPSSLQNYGITMFDIEKFSEVFGVSIRRQEDLSLIDDPGDDLFFRISGFAPEILKLEIQELKNNISEKQGRITLYLDNNSLKREDRSGTLTCNFEEGAPFSLIVKLAKGKNPIKRSDLGDESTNWSRTVKEINERTKEKLTLKESLVINNKGYQLNHDWYRIVYKK